MEIVKRTRKSTKAFRDAEEATKQAQDAIKEAEAKAETARLEYENAMAEEKQMLEDTEKAIADIAAGKELFCGVILTPDDITAIVSLAIKTKENIKIPFRLYFNE